MKIKINYFLLLLIILFSSCSSDDNSKKQSSSKFRFLEFKKDVLIPSINSGDITFYGVNFDNNLNNWQLNLVNEDNASFPVNITSVENTSISFKNGENLQEIKFNAPSLDYGDYTLLIKNKSTNQTYTDTFLIRSNTFNKISYENQSSYGISAFTDITENLYFYHNITNTIESNIKTNHIVGVKLYNKNTLAEVTLDYSINSNNKIEFVIPSSVTPGTYYLSVNYKNLINSYFEKDILVLEEQSPTISKISKKTFKGGEVMKISGKNFRYKVNFDLLPINDLFEPFPNSSLIFKDATGVGQEIISPYKSNSTYSYINAEGTEINFPIPKNNFFITGSDNQGYYFEGKVIVRSGPYLSEPISIRINY